MKLTEKIALEVQKSLNQGGTFTNNHVRYNVRLDYNNKSYFTEYQTAQEIDKNDIIYCVLSDAQCYEYTRNIDEFMQEFGYNNGKISEGIKAFEGCKKAFEELSKMFTNSEIEKLHEELEEMGY